LTVVRGDAQALRMSLEVPGRRRPAYLKIAILLFAMGVAAVLVLRGVNLRALADQGMGILRDAGPVAFFTAMAVFPALGVPMLVFTLTVGPTFGQRLGIGWVMVLSMAALTVNILLTYALARRALRPLLERLIAPARI